MISFDDRIALVTGAGRGIGFSIASVLAQLGARVAVNDVDAQAAEAAAEKIGNGAFAAAGNVVEVADAEAILATVERTAGRIDVLVNNAGVAPPRVNLQSLDIEAWQRVIDVNLRGTLVMSKAAALRMIDQRSGAIVNIVSIVGMTPFPASHAYGVSKAGAVMLTKTLASELARYGIRVNAVAPGVTDAPMLGATGVQPADLSPILNRTPLGRLGQPEEIGKAVAFLASDAASYITGTVLPVDGGWLSFGGWGAVPQAR